MSDFEENFTSERVETSEQFGRFPRWLLDLKPSSNAVRIYVYLDCVFGNSKRGIFPGQERIAEDNDLSKKSVQRALQELQDLKALQIKRRGQGKTNLYALMWFNPAKPQPAPVARKTTRPASRKPANKEPLTVNRPRVIHSVKSQAERDEINAKRAEDEKRRADVEAKRQAERKAMSAEQDRMRFESVIEGINL